MADKISKSNQDPHQTDSDREALKKLLSKKSQHFSVGSHVLANNVRGEIVGITKDGGTLINTGCTMLVEGNDWGDKFWGRCLDKTTGRWVGLNTLGVILMEERGIWSRGDLSNL